MTSRTHVTRTPRALILALLACSLTLSAAIKGPDGGGYVAKDEVIYSFVDISGQGGGVSVLTGTDDGTAPLALEFQFRMYGTLYPVACVSTNGAVYFMASAATCTGFGADFANTDITATSVPNDRPALLPLWTDLTFDSPVAGSVLYHTLGTAPNRRFVIQWNNAIPQGSGSPVTFQAILFETSNRVLFQYKTVSLTGGDPARNGGRATVGIRNAAAPGNSQQLQWSHRAAVLTDESAVEFAAPSGSADTTAPTITATATPTRLRPPNGKTVSVRVQGTMSDAGSGLAASSARYDVVDEYGKVQPSGPITIGTGGAYSVNVPLMASRLGTDKDGRTYTITILVRDAAGNEGRKSVVVIVPHDQG